MYITPSPKFKRTIAYTIASIIMLMLLSMLDLNTDYETQRLADQHTIDSLRTVNRNLTIDLNVAKDKNRDVDELDQMLLSIRQKGYTPNKLLVRQIQKQMKIFPMITWDFLQEVYATESSWGQNDNKGMLGEFGHSQMLPATAKLYYVLLGGNPDEFNPDDYADIKSNTELAFVMYLDMKRRGKLNYRNWNAGWFDNKPIDQGYGK